MYQRATRRAIKTFIVACFALFRLTPDARAIDHDDWITTWAASPQLFGVLIS
jgi:hypothetical protein